jgi:hypothetical protein
MEDTATHESGPVDAPASAESIAAEILAGGETEPSDALQEVTEELVNEAKGTGEAEEAPETEDDATEPADEAADEPEEATPEESEEADPLEKLIATNPDLKVKVKVNGETIEVPVSDLTKGYSRTEDYKAKTAAVAEERRQVEAERARVETDVSAKFANQLEEATNLFAQFDPVLQEANRIDWQALKQQDPAAFVAAQDAVQERLNAIGQMNKHIAETRERHSAAQQDQIETERAQRFDAAADAIVKEYPEYADEAKFKVFANEAVATLKEVGFTGEEIVDALDERMLKAAVLIKEGLAARKAKQSLPERKVVPKSAVKPLTTDGTGSQTSKPRFPSNATREAKGDWIARQILSSE